MRAAVTILRARASETTSNFRNQFQQRPNLRSILNLMETLDTPTKDRYTTDTSIRCLVFRLMLCYYNAFNPKNVKYWNGSFQKKVWTKSLTDENIFRMSLKLIIFSCTHAETLREPIMKFWLSCKRTQNIILTKQYNRDSMKCILGMVNLCHLCHAATLREPIVKFWLSCKRTQNIILTKQYNRDSMKCMLGMINHCHLETAFIKFPSCHFKEQFKTRQCFNTVCNTRRKVQNMSQKEFFLRGSWNPLGPVVQNPD